MYSADKYMSTLIISSYSESWVLETCCKKILLLLLNVSIFFLDVINQFALKASSDLEDVKIALEKNKRQDPSSHFLPSLNQDKPQPENQKQTSQEDWFTVKKHEQESSADAPRKMPKLPVYGTKLEPIQKK